MKYFGTVKSYDEMSGHGFIDPETGGDPLRFAQGSGSWTHVAPPRPASASRTMCITPTADPAQ